MKEIDENVYNQIRSFVFQSSREWDFNDSMCVSGNIRISHIPSVSIVRIRLTCANDVNGAFVPSSLHFIIAQEMKAQFLLNTYKTDESKSVSKILKSHLMRTLASLGLIEAARTWTVTQRTQWHDDDATSHHTFCQHQQRCHHPSNQST